MPTHNKSLEVGDSFELTNNFGLHLHVVVAEASPDDSATIFLVYVSSANVPYRDPTTIIKVGEHPYIKKTSWVRYQNVIICSRDSIRGSMGDHYGKVTPDLLNKIQDGIGKTDRVNDIDKNLFRQWKMDKLYRELF